MKYNEYKEVYIKDNTNSNINVIIKHYVKIEMKR